MRIQHPVPKAESQLSGETHGEYVVDNVWFRQVLAWNGGIIDERGIACPRKFASQQGTAILSTAV